MYVSVVTLYTNLWSAPFLTFHWETVIVEEVILAGGNFAAELSEALSDDLFPTWRQEQTDWRRRLCHGGFLPEFAAAASAAADDVRSVSNVGDLSPESRVF